MHDAAQDDAGGPSTLTLQLGDEARHALRIALPAGYFRLGIDCPFLENDRCSIYADRPLTCRQVLVTTPAAYCAAPDSNTIELLRMPMIARTLFFLTSDEEPARPARVPLLFVLEWAASRPAVPPERKADQWMQRFVSRLAAA